MQFTKEVKVQVPDGLHHQTAATFIQTANRFSSLIRVTYGTNNVNAKSLYLGGEGRPTRQRQKPAGRAFPLHRDGGARHAGGRGG